MEIVPIMYLNQITNNNFNKITTNFNSVMLIEGKCNELTDQISSSKQWIEKIPNNTSIYYDLCICSSNTDGHCRVYNNDKYNKNETIKLFSEKIEYLLKNTHIRSIILSDMNIDTFKFIHNNYNSSIDIWYEYKTKSQLYNAFRSIMKLPFIQKEYHLEGVDLDFLSEIMKYTSNIILKPCLTTIDMNYNLSHLGKIYVSAFITSAEAIMMKHLNQNYHIDYLSELTLQLKRIGYNKLFVPNELLI